MKSMVCSFALLLCFVACPRITQAQSKVKKINVTFTTIDVPGSWEVTSVQGINTAGDMVGIYAASNQASTPPHGFLLSAGTFTYIDYPGAYGTFTDGINDSGTIIGYATFNGGTTADGFFYDGISFSEFQAGKNSGTFAMGTDNAGDAVGGAGSINTTKGFEMRGQTFRTISPPPGGYVYVYSTAINNLGEIVGWAAGSAEQGFAFKAGKYHTISVPGAYQTEAHGVNDSGMITGWYSLGATDNGFVLMNGKYFSFSYPGAVGTYPSAINASGQVVGSYTLDFVTFHGFVTSPIAVPKPL